MKLAATYTSQAGCCSSDAPYILISRQRSMQDKDFVIVHKTEVAQSATPVFRDF